jgi:hypothetical protein
MKKILLIAAVAGLAMASCKKDRTCTCTITPTSGTTTTETKVMYKVKKDEAQRECIGGQYTYTSGGQTFTSSDTKCELK